MKLQEFIHEAIANATKEDAASWASDDEKTLFVLDYFDMFNLCFSVSSDIFSYAQNKLEDQFDSLLA